MRYIDVDALIEKIQETVCTKCGDIYDGIKCKSCGIDDTLNFLEDAPTADVVPMGEVQEIFKEFDRMFERYGYEPYYTVQDMEIEVNILKEKYTKGGAKE